MFNRTGSVYFVVKTVLGAHPQRKCQMAEKNMPNYPSVQQAPADVSNQIENDNLSTQKWTFYRTVQSI